MEGFPKEANLKDGRGDEKKPQEGRNEQRGCGGAEHARSFPCFFFSFPCEIVPLPCRKGTICERERERAGQGPEPEIA